MRPSFAVYRQKDQEYSGGFEQLLRREKTLYSLCENETDDPVICFEHVFPAWAYGYVEKGGIAVVSGAGKNTFGFDAGYTSRASLAYIDLSDFNQGKTRICSSVCVFSGEGKGKLTLHENRTIKDNRYPGFYPVFLYKKLGKGTIIYSGVPLVQLLTHEGSDLRQTSELLDYDEHVSSIDKQKIAAAVKNVLVEAMHMAGLPYVSLWYYPDGARNIFAFSIDGDGLLQEGVDNLIEAAEQTDTRFLFYISKQLCEQDPDVKKKLQDIGKRNIIASHGGIHNGKDSYEENLEDLRILEEWLDSMNIGFVKSYAAPRGMYCHSLGKALKDAGYLHSRDFGFVIDDYPFFPMNEGIQDTVLQMPCDGFNVCRLMGFHEEKGLPLPEAEEIITDYQKLIDYKLERDLPLLFFCHPQYFGLYAKEVYPQIIAYVRNKGVLTTDYVSYGDFWLLRDNSEYDADYTEEGLKIDIRHMDPEVRICVDGKIYNQ